MESVEITQEIQMDQKARDLQKAQKKRREEPEKEPTPPQKIDTEEDVLEKVVRGLEYRYGKHQFYKPLYHMTAKL